MARIGNASGVEKRKCNQTTLATQIVVDVCLSLAEFGPYIYAASPKTCSFYIKFHQRGLGTLRISNHNSKYLYKWNINVHDSFKDKVTNENNTFQYYANYKNKDTFLNFMRETFNK